MAGKPLHEVLPNQETLDEVRALLDLERRSWEDTRRDTEKQPWMFVDTKVTCAYADGAIHGLSVALNILEKGLAYKVGPPS
jgi:hypothetical protein